MSFVAVAVVGSAAIGAYATSKASSKASQAQQYGVDKGVSENTRQFDAAQKLLAPYNDAGQSALFEMMNLSGANGEDAYRSSISAIENGPKYESLVRNGEAAILGNASATGGLRGGNTQAALAEFRPEMLSRLIDQKYSQLGGIATMGQNSAAGTGAAAMQTGQANSALYQQGAAAQAGNHLAQGQIVSGLANSVGNLIGTGGF